MRLYLITHAHTTQNPGAAADTWKLSPRGIDEARALASDPMWRQVTQVVVSSEEKSWLTVEGIAEKLGLPVWLDSRFDELRRGGWVEDYSRQVAAVFDEPTQSVAGWESAQSALDRVLRGLSALQIRFPQGTVALVGHGITLSLLRSRLLGESKVNHEDWQRLGFGSVAEVSLGLPAVVQDFALGAKLIRST